MVKQYWIETKADFARIYELEAEKDQHVYLIGVYRSIWLERFPGTWRRDSVKSWGSLFVRVMTVHQACHSLNRFNPLEISLSISTSISQK